ncbi:hypothetical protein [Vibrio bivalvicida]|uniref:Uncharacterized protein n=1 Tax=Vibrio bivalvicida TaxID=1276888 RepID=A0A177Y2J7_9VIBR|nr:hypothetical protein [Vibrio bivalvicida]OAJ95109.1 hypothetical protein APB76_07450 [Vibrio bivalvicida]
MPLNWENDDNELDSILDAAAATTDKKLASRISSITHMTDEEVLELFPTSEDVQKLNDLMKIVKSSEDRNLKVSKIVNNAEEFGGVILTLITKFA